MATTRNIPPFGTTMKRQSGAVLIVGLIFLVVLTLLGLTAAQTGIMEEHMAGNTRDRNLAFQAAEAALRDAENDINCVTISGTAQTSTRSFGCIKGMTGATSGCNTVGLCCNISASGLACYEPATPVYTNLTSTTSTGVQYGHYTSAPNLPTVGKQPQYLIEPFWNQGHNYYRISAQGYGANASTTVTLQEVYKT
jgi:type IV pilus assembly protein PilX